MKIVDLFAGCGGMSRGFQNAGFDIVGAFEFWELAVKCYKQNFNHDVYCQDLSDTDASVKIIASLNTDIIIGGPPCQDFSHAGKRIEDKRAGLTESFANIVSRINPTYFVMENVDRARKSEAYAEARSVFKKAGYGLTEIVLDASLCGVPQKRKRFFCIGSLNEEDGFLDEYITEKLDTKPKTLRDYFGETLDFEFYYRHPRNYSRRGIFSIDEPAPTIRGVNRPVPNGYQGHSNDACQLSPFVRSMTTLERALVQTFPADYKWVGNKTEMEQMIGNAVPVKLAEFVAKALMCHISQKQETCTSDIAYDSFHDWLDETQPLAARTKRDIVSRLRRADSIYSIGSCPDDFYFFNLEHSQSFEILSSDVRSQVKRAVSLYKDFCTSRMCYQSV